MSVDDLAAWLTQVWDEREAAAIKAGGDEWHLDGANIYRNHPTEDVVDWVYDEAWEHIAINDPKSMLARIAADRQILADYLDACRSYTIERTPFREGQRFGLLLALTRLAEGYADHPGFREEWRA